MVAKPTQEPKKASKKGKTTKAGNKSKKPAAPMNMIATPDALLTIPVGEIPATLPRCNLDKAFDYPVKMHTAKQGKYAGVAKPQLQITDADGVVHNLYHDEGKHIGQAILKNPLVVYHLIAFAQDNS